MHSKHMPSYVLLKSRPLLKIEIKNGSAHRGEVDRPNQVLKTILL